MIANALWGLKTVAMFDAWSIEHVLSGMSIGYLIRRSNRSAFSVAMRAPDQGRVRLRFDLVAVGFAAYLWEAVEHYLESGLAGHDVAFWFQGVEVWSNRLIADPAMLVLGYWLISRWPRLVSPARWASGVWLIVHIFVFPHSMYLHELAARATWRDAQAPPAAFAIRSRILTFFSPSSGASNGCRSAMTASQKSSISS